MDVDGQVPPRSIVGDLTKFVAPEALQEMQAILHAAREHAKEIRGKKGGDGGKKPKHNQKLQKAEARARAENLLQRLLLVIDEHGGVLDCVWDTMHKKAGRIAFVKSFS